MKQPPAEREIPAIRLGVVAQSLGQVVIIILQADGRVVGRRRGQGDNTGQVVTAAEEVELSSGEDGQQRKGIYEGEGSCDGC